MQGGRSDRDGAFGVNGSLHSKFMLAFFDVSESVFELFDPDEGDDGVRAEADEGRHVASEERHRTLAEGEADHVKRTCAGGC